MNEQDKIAFAETLAWMSEGFGVFDSKQIAKAFFQAALEYRDSQPRTVETALGTAKVLSEGQTMNEQDKQAFAEAAKGWATKSAGKDLGEYFFQAALEYARGKQEPVAWVNYNPTDGSKWYSDMQENIDSEPLYTAAPAAEVNAQHPALLWVLYHHQGSSSFAGQPIRAALGIGQYDRLTDEQIARAKEWAEQQGKGE